MTAANVPGYLATRDDHGNGCRYNLDRGGWWRCECGTGTTPGAQVESAAYRPEPWEVDGSYLIERYEHTNPNGVQWLVYRVEDGKLWMKVALKTRKEAALYVAGLKN